MSEGVEKGWLLSQYGSLRGRDWRDTFHGGFSGFRQQLFDAPKRGLLFPPLQTSVLKEEQRR